MTKQLNMHAWNEYAAEELGRELLLALYAEGRLLSLSTFQVPDARHRAS